MLDFIKRYRNWFLAIVLSFLVVLPTLLLSNFMIIDQDTWIALYGAKRIFEGQLLYKNFFDFVTPGTDYVLASAFYLFGVKLSVARIALAVSNGVAVAIVVSMSSYAIKNKLLSLLLPVLTTIYASYNYYISHHYFILVPVLLVMFSGIKNIKEQESKPNEWFFTGLATAGTFLFIQSIGVTLFGMIILFIIWFHTVDKLRIRSILQPLTYYSSGFVLPLIFVVIIFALSGSLSAFIYDSFLWPLIHYRIMNINSLSRFLIVLLDGVTNKGLSPAILNGFIGYLGILLGISVFIYMWVKYKGKKTEGLSLVVFASVVCIGVISGLIQNPTINHVMVFLPVYLFLIILLYEYEPVYDKKTFRVGFSLYFLFITITLIYNSYRAYSLIYDTLYNNSVIVQTPVGKIRMFKSYKILSDTGISDPRVFLKEMDGKLTKNIFVLYWSPSIYMLTGTENPTPLNTYMPYYNTKEQAMSAIQALKTNHTEIIVIDSTLEYAKYMYTHHKGWAWHDQRIFSPDEPLISYINAHYRLDKIIPGYKIYRLVK